MKLQQLESQGNTQTPHLHPQSPLYLIMAEKWHKWYKFKSRTLKSEYHMIEKESNDEFKSFSTFTALFLFLLSQLEECIP